MAEQNSRRTFIKQAGAAGALTAASYSRVLGANDRIQMAIVGAGGRGRNVMEIFNKIGASKVEYIAVCDVYEPYALAAQSRAGGKPRIYRDYRELLARAEQLTDVHERSALVREALKALIEREAARRLARLGGSEPKLRPIPRRRSR